MENPEWSRALANWLQYYRQLGFTHLYSRDSSQLSRLDRAVADAVSLPPEKQRDQPASSREPGQSRPASSSTPASASGPATVLAARSPIPVSPVRVPSPPGGSLFDAITARETLPQVREDLGDCRRCKLWKGRQNIVFGDGNPKAQLVFVGEGPGADEDEQGLPFVGRAGQLLTDMIEKGLKIPRPEVYICNIIKCRPPENRKPEKEEVAACRQFVERQIDAIRPRMICALGATAAETLLGVRESMGNLRGQWYEFHGIPVLVTYHPAFLLRDPTKKPEAWADLKKIRAYLSSSPSAATND